MNHDKLCIPAAADAMLRGLPNCAKRLECVELATAVERRRPLKTPGSSTHSKRFALCLTEMWCARSKAFHSRVDVVP